MVKTKLPDMRKRMQIASILTAGTALATSLALFSSPVRAWAAEGDRASEVITTTEEHGRKVYVNETIPAPARATPAPQPKRATWMYWSTRENRWKPVPSANTPSMQAARSAAAEIGQFVHESSKSANARIMAANSRGHQATPEEVDAAIVMAAARHNVDPNLVRAVVKVESNYNSHAISNKGAMGLMQLMPSTAKMLKVKNPFDAQQNVDAGVRHLKSLLESYGGDVKLTLAAYNAGEGAVARSAGVPHFAETQDYVRRITNLYYGGFDFAPSGASRDPVHVQRDARGVLYISNTD